MANTITLKNNVKSIANADEDEYGTSILMQFDDIMDDGNISKDDDIIDFEPTVLSLNLFDVESVYESDTDVCY